MKHVFVEHVYVTVCLYACAFCAFLVPLSGLHVFWSTAVQEIIQWHPKGF